MPVLADPNTVAGPLRAEDLDRAANPGRIYHLHRATVAQCPPCHGMCQQGRTCNAGDDACAAEGGQHADPVPSGSVLSMRRHRRTRATVARALALAAAGYAVRLAWPLLGA